MIFWSAKLLAVILIGCVAATPVELHKRAQLHKRDQKVIIGYRIVHPVCELVFCLFFSGTIILNALAHTY